jgi:hypothetical protein
MIYREFARSLEGSFPTVKFQAAFRAVKQVEPWVK